VDTLEGFLSEATRRVDVGLPLEETIGAVQNEKHECFFKAGNGL